MSISASACLWNRYNDEHVDVRSIEAILSQLETPLDKFEGEVTTRYHLRLLLEKKTGPSAKDPAKSYVAGFERFLISNTYTGGLYKKIRCFIYVLHSYEALVAPVTIVGETRIQGRVLSRP